VKPNGRGLRTADLAALNLDALAVAVFSQLASTYRTSRDEPDTVLLFRPADEAEARRLERDLHEARKAQRGTVTRAELEEVARIYREYVDSSPTQAVAALGGYDSQRTAARRVQQAREAGLLPKTTPGKRRA
jgi:predicted PP-loop superfamily ATPase